MSLGRRAARRAGALSLALHAGLVGLLLAVLRQAGSERSAAPPVEVGVVAMSVPVAPARPAGPIFDLPRSAPPPSPLPGVLTAPSALIAEAPRVAPAGAVQVVGHQVTAPMHSDQSPRTHSDESRGRPEDQLPAGAVTAFYGVPAVGKSVVYVLDRSASMGLGDRLDRARTQVAASLRRLPSDARFQVIAYDLGAAPLRIGTGGLLAATPANVAAAVAALERLNAEGGTDHLRALRLALTLQPDVIYFLTDEDDLTPQTVTEVTRLNRRRSSVHALCLSGEGGSAMQALARDNRGVFRVVE